MQKIKVGIVGTGFIGPTHIEAVRRLGFVDVIGLVESDPDIAAKKASELSIPNSYGNLSEMLKDPEIEVIHNCTPNHLHFQINKEIILAGKHIISEKPLALSSEESRELLKLAREHKIVHGINFSYRQFPIIRQLKSMVDNQKLGNINIIHGSYLQDWLLFDTDYNWRLSPEVGGRSRAVADIGSHWCDTIQYVTGKKIVEVLADLATIVPIRKKPKGSGTTFGLSSNQGDLYELVPITTEDYAAVIIKFKDGSLGTFIVSQVSAGRKNRLSFELNGSNSSAAWNQEEPEKLWIGHRDRPNEILMADPSLFAEEARSQIHHPGGHNEGWPDALKNMMLNFYTYILEGKNPLTDPAPFATFEDGHISMCITDAILESHENGRWVKVKVTDCLIA